MSSESFFESDNPLTEHLGDTFFDQLPKTPGVYKMYGTSGQLLYVGKAKNLRNRLFTYRRARVGRESRKIIRLVRMVRRIELEVLPSEEQALLRENELIRRHKPGFNRAKKQHEAYYYLTFKTEETTIRVDLRMHCREEEKLYTYGAFKGHQTVRRGVGALLRQIYILEHKARRAFDLPSKLLGKLTPMHCMLDVRETGKGGWLSAAEAFLEGRSLHFLECVVKNAHEQELLETFLGKMILKDLEAMRFFYDRCTNKNFQIKETFGLEHSPVPQEKLDDYLVKLAFLEEE